MYFAPYPFQGKSTESCTAASGYSRMYFGSLLLLLLLAACVYEPDGLYEKEIDPPPTVAPTLDVNLNIVTDTIFLPLQGEVRFSVASPDTLMRLSAFLMNHYILGAVRSNEGHITVSFENKGFVEKLAYQLRVEIFRSSGTGSLADKLHQEGYVYRKNYTVYFYNRHALSDPWHYAIPQVRKVFRDDGRIRIEWEYFRGTGFKAYHVYNGNDRKIAEIENQFETFCHDPFHIGFTQAWYVITYSEYDAFRSAYRTFNDTLPAASVSRDQDNSYSIRWGETRYPKNLSGHRIWEFLTDTEQYREIAFVPGPEITSYRYNDPVFPSGMRFYVQPVGHLTDYEIKNKWDLELWAVKTGSISHGEPFPSFWFDRFENHAGRYAYSGADHYLYRFDKQSATITDSVSYTLGSYSVSPDGKFVLAADAGSMHLFGPDFTLIKEIDFNKLPEKVRPIQFIIGNNGTGVMIGFRSSYLYDFINERNLSEFHLVYRNNWPLRMRISPDGKLLCSSNKINETETWADLYEITADQKVLSKWTVKTDFFDIDPQNGEFIFLEGNTLKYYHKETGTIAVKQTIPDKHLLDIDWYSREYLSLNEAGTVMSIYNLDSGQPVKQIRTNLRPPYKDFFLANRSVISNYRYNTRILKSSF